MQITARTSGNYTILKLDGRLVLGGALMELRNAVRDAARKHPSRIILNLANVRTTQPMPTKTIAVMKISLPQSISNISTRQPLTTLRLEWTGQRMAQETEIQL